MKKSFITAAIAVSALFITSCDKQSGWSISGEIAGADDRTLVIEGFNNGMWYVVDSVKTTNGEFKYNASAPADYPEVMRLGMDGQYIYFPVDSVDHVSLMADAADFTNSYRLDGTLQARNIRSIDSLLNASVSSRGVLTTIADTDLKHQLFNKAFDDPSVMSVYYLINKTLGDQPLYDITNPADVRLYGAVAQRFANERPNDPRSKYLADTYKRARMANGEVKPREFVANEISIIDIERADVRGQKHSLAEMASKGDVVILSFTAYNMESSPAYNVVLNSIYEKYRNQGLQIYQIAFDGDETSWKQTARNLPWTAVWNSTTDSNAPLVEYNVGALPMTFIIDRQGSIAARVADPTQLEAEVKKYL